jgi:glycolate oxidase FAD binding subunit
MQETPPTSHHQGPWPDLPALIDSIRSAASLPAGQRPAFRIHGSGSHDFFGESLTGELLETRGLSGILQYEPSELVVTVAAGTPLHELETALSEQGQCLAFEPPHFQANVGNKPHSLSLIHISEPTRPCH